MSLLPTNKLSIYELIVVPKLIALLKGCQMWLYVRFTSSWSWLHLLVHLIGLSTISSGRFWEPVEFPCREFSSSFPGIFRLAPRLLSPSWSLGCRSEGCHCLAACWNWCDVMSLIVHRFFTTFAAFQIYCRQVPPWLGFTVGFFSGTVSDCDCELYYAEDTE